jgi:hypothetical protein
MAGFLQGQAWRRQVMIAANVNPNDAPVEHIGATPHALRNILVAVALAAMAGILMLFYWQSGRADDAAAIELAQFRQAMFNRCGDEQFAGSADPRLVELYADSSRMREVVVKQFHLLQKFDTRCDSVARALRAADYPIR